MIFYPLFISLGRGLAAERDFGVHQFKGNTSCDATLNARPSHIGQPYRTREKKAVRMKTRQCDTLDLLSCKIGPPQALRSLAGLNSSVRLFVYAVIWLTVPFSYRIANGLCIYCKRISLFR